MFDYHLHSLFSDDVKPEWGGSVDKLCRVAIEKGFTEIAVTDHFDTDAQYYGFFPLIDLQGLYKEVQAAKVEYAGRVNLLFGLEVGQANHMPKETNRVLERFPFDFVLGSIHSTRGNPDFYYLDLTAMSDEMLEAEWFRYLSELKELIAWGNFDSLAHLTYPLRYYTRAGKESILKLNTHGRDYFEPILRGIIEKGISLEVNTSGLRQGLNSVIPSADLLAFYKELGGEMVTVGSDGHRLEHFGFGVKEGRELLSSLGFKYITRYNQRKPFMEAL